MGLFNEVDEKSSIEKEWTKERMHRPWISVAELQGLIVEFSLTFAATRHLFIMLQGSSYSKPETPRFDLLFCIVVAADAKISNMF